MNLESYEIVLESCHPNIDRAEIDMLVILTDQREQFVFEFKFDREIPSGYVFPRPMKAGKQFADLVRLSKYKKHHKKCKCFLSM